jgi:hypothetical protein
MADVVGFLEEAGIDFDMLEHARTERLLGWRSAAVGVEAFPGRGPNDVVLWIENGRAVIAGDPLVDFGQGLEIPPELVT